MKQFRIFIWLKVKEIGIALGVIIGFLFVILSGVFFINTVEHGFHSGIPNWFEIPMVIIGACMFLLAAGVLVVCGCYALIKIPSWIKANWQKAGELAKKS